MTLQRIKCFFGFHTWGDDLVLHERPTSYRTGVAWYTRHCIHCDQPKVTH